MGEYFDVMDDFIDRYNEIQNTPIDEYIFVHCNPWIIDSLAATDYYIMKEKGNTVLDNRNLIILNRGDKLNLPDSAEIIKIKLKLDSIWLDVNIPEYKLRIRKGDEVLYTCLLYTSRCHFTIIYAPLFWQECKFFHLLYMIKQRIVFFQYVFIKLQYLGITD